MPTPYGTLRCPRCHPRPWEELDPLVVFATERLAIIDVAPDGTALTITGLVQLLHRDRPVLHPHQRLVPPPPPPVPPWKLTLDILRRRPYTRRLPHAVD
jgi:hypothetical protein